MPKEKYIKNIKQLDKKISTVDTKIIKLEKNIKKFYANPKFRIGNKLTQNLNKEPDTLKQFKKIVDQDSKLFKLDKER